MYGTMASVLLDMFEGEVRSFLETDVLVNTGVIATASCLAAH